MNNPKIVPIMIDAAEHASIETHPLRRNISVLEGSGGNIAVLTGKDGTLLVDSGFKVSEARLRAAISNLSPNPITQLVNTHWHTDHTDGNEWVHAAGGEITAHVNTKKHLAISTRVEGWAWTFPAAPSGALPSKVFDQELTLQHNESRIGLNYYGPAHTDSDISVFFEEANVLLVADTWWNGIYPFIDYSTGGNIDGMIQATNRNLSVISDDTLIVPGHGPTGDKAGLTEFRDMLVEIRHNISELKRQGKSLDETIAAKPTAKYDAKFGQFLITPPFFTFLVYSGV